MAYIGQGEEPSFIIGLWCLNDEVYCFVMSCNYESFLGMGAHMHIRGGAMCLFHFYGMVYSWDLAV